jgi:hypothetical protein
MDSKYANEYYLTLNKNTFDTRIVFINKRPVVDYSPEGKPLIQDDQEEEVVDRIEIVMPIMLIADLRDALSDAYDNVIEHIGNLSGEETK